MPTETLIAPPPHKLGGAEARPRAGRLLMMVCDAALRDVAAAEAALHTGRPDAARANIRRAQCILLEVMASVDIAAGPDVSDALRALCQVLLNGLSEASISRDPARLRRAHRRIVRMRDALAPEGREPRGMCQAGESGMRP